MQAAPLSPTPSTALNFSTPSTNPRYESYEVRTCTRTSNTSQSGDDAENEEGNSSPFLPHVMDDGGSPTPTSRGPSPPKVRPMSRVISGSELSPLKILQQQPTATIEETASPAKTMPPPALIPQSPRKMSSPIKRFPVKVNTPLANETPRRASQERRISLQDAVRENEGLKHAIEIFEDEENVLDTEPPREQSGNGNNDIDDNDNVDDTMLMGASAAGPEQSRGRYHDQEQDEDHDPGYADEPAGIDDTMISTFSTFSAVPNMTMLAQMRSNSPTKYSVMGGATPRTVRGDPTATIKTQRANGPLPDRSGSGNTINLMDFTEQMRFGGYPSEPRRSNPSPSRQNGSAVPSTPQRSHLVNLLDFDIPPMPTPRSIPTVTPRELESLKSGFLSEISSLKASLSGKEAEVMSLKTAVGDAEKRVGECMEQLREVQGMQGSLVAEKDSWEKRGREMESVLRKVKEEIVLGQREREELEFKLDEAEKRREAAEMMAQEAESKMAGMRAGKASAEAAAASGSPIPAAVGSNKEVEIAVERVARELHALYKSKHETKVTALKKSYENRWEKKVRELQSQVDELARDNEELRVGRDATITKVDLARLAELEDERKEEKAKDAAHIKELEAEVEKYEAVIKTVKSDNAELRVLLERERVEKGELVMLAEEMMNMQTQAPVESQQPPQNHNNYSQQPLQNNYNQQPPQNNYNQQPSQSNYNQQPPQNQNYNGSNGSNGSNGNYNNGNSGNYSNGNNGYSNGNNGYNNANNGYSGNPAPTPNRHSGVPSEAANRTPARSSMQSVRGTPLTATKSAYSSSIAEGGNGSTNNGGSFRGSISGPRASGLRAPGGGPVAGVSGLSKIGRVPTHERAKSAAMGGSGVPRPGSGLGMRSGGIMSSIEKMGSYRGGRAD
ncbi:hypothetical protein B0T25DRAFT_578262 [Lasiosphaeria hispida]|uniref:Kinetoplast-associated protein KAP n=1 Tax=Lasiosphaeria hispida TaxID=260671 RepID=A0AAJ0HRT3_9PEZI|nr:hypothetical protein B0T25DRAFT_578262 [Lasiosphaeria hispida]